MKKIAVIGSGISGLSAAWALHRNAEVSVFERDNRIGGHAHTVDVKLNNRTVPVDVGFIVCNPLNYPNFMAFMDALGVETIASDMSFSVSGPNGYEWSSNPAGLFARKRNILRPDYIRFLLDILHFNKAAKADLAAGTIPPDMSLGEYLGRLGMNDRFRENYILPMGAAIWSTPEANMHAYPARAFLDFFNNHKLLHTERPSWRTVKQGSRSYVAKLAAVLGERVRLSVAVEQIARTPDGITVQHSEGSDVFDDVILSCSAPAAGQILGPGFEDQSNALRGVRTTSNHAILHSDPVLMPKRKAAWAAWNVLKGSEEAVTLTYWMNTLQNIDRSCPLFVTLNPDRAPDPKRVHGVFAFDHPLFDKESQIAVQKIETLNGQSNVWFSGAWLGHGFHEDGLKSGLRVALSLGGTVPWEPVGIVPFPGRSVISGPDDDVPQLLAAQ